MNSNIQTSLPLEASLTVRELAGKAGVTVSQWVRQVIMERIAADVEDNAVRAGAIAARMKDVQRRYS